MFDLQEVQVELNATWPTSFLVLLPSVQSTSHSNLTSITVSVSFSGSLSFSFCLFFGPSLLQLQISPLFKCLDKMNSPELLMKSCSFRQELQIPVSSD